jgi:hypothetical protein
MPNETLEQTADRLAGDALKTYSAFQEQLKGTPGSNYSDFQSVQASAQAMAQIGSKAAENIGKIREDYTMPDDMKAKRVSLIESNAEAIMQDMRQSVVKGVERIESSLMDAIKPTPLTDPTKQLLARQELEMLIAAAMPPRPADQPGGPTMLQTLTTLAVSNPDHAAEILGTFGQALMARSKEQASISALHKNVVRTLAGIPGGTPQAQASKQALAAIDKVKGMAEGFRQAGKMRLDATRPSGIKLSPPNSPDTIAPQYQRPVSSQDLKSKQRGKR